MDAASQARRLAQALDGDAIETEHGWYVRRELRPVYLPLDRARLAALPGMRGGGTLVDTADRDALYQAMEGR